jgi:arylsulfatase A-like enzyme
MKKILVAALLYALIGGSIFAKNNKPNVILFLVDDMGLMDTSVPMLVDKDGKPQKHPLNKFYRTPNMERLAKQGVRFSQFYAQSVCSPTRVSLMTGQNSARHRVTQWINPETKNQGPAGWDWKGLTSKDITLPALLKKNGYHTIFSGKAHFAPTEYEGADPANLGFDVNIAGCAFGAPGSYLGEDGYGNLDPKRKKRAIPGLEKYHNTDVFLSEAITREAISAIDNSLKKESPFFLYMSHYAAHSPFQTDSRFGDNYKDSGKSRPANSFATLIEGMDKSLGDLMNHLERKGVAENTLILFVGDNGSDAPLGDTYGYFSSAPLRGKKGTCYEGGLRVPFIAGWAKPGEANSFSISQNAVHHQQIGTVMDIYATILDATGTKNPGNHIIDGVSLIPQLKGTKNPDRPDHFLCHFPHSHRSSYFTTYRKGDWKLIYRYRTTGNAEQRAKKAKDALPTCELFNLKDDPYEKTNLAKQKPNKLKTMVKQMMDQLETENAIYAIDSNKGELKPFLP